MTCKYKSSTPDVVPLEFLTGDEADLEPVDITWVMSSCTGGFDGSFDVLGFVTPETTRNIDLDADGYYDWDPEDVPSRSDLPPVPEKSGQQAKLTAFAPKDLYKTTKTVQKITTKVWSKEQTKSLKQTLTVKK